MIWIKTLNACWMHVCVCVCVYIAILIPCTWMNLVILKWSWKFVHPNIGGTLRTHFYVSNMIYFTIWTSIPLNLTHVQCKDLKVKFTQFFEDIFNFLFKWMCSQRIMEGMIFVFCRLGGNPCCNPTSEALYYAPFYCRYNSSGVLIPNLG
jgi:hypothetical protein